MTMHHDHAIGDARSMIQHRTEDCAVLEPVAFIVEYDRLPRPVFSVLLAELAEAEGLTVAWEATA